MNSGNNSPLHHYQLLNIIFTAVLLSASIFSGIAIFLVVTGENEQLYANPETSGMLKLIFLILTVILLPASHLLHRKRIEQIPANKHLEEKLMLYRNSFIIKLALIETVCFVCLVTFFLTRDYILIIPLVLIIAFIALNRPGILKITSELKLNNEEREKLSG